MIKQLITAMLTATFSLLLPSCDYDYMVVVGGLTQQRSYLALKTVNTTSGKLTYFDTLNIQKLIFKNHDTLILEQNGKIVHELYKFDFLRWGGRQKDGILIYEGKGPKYKTKSIRITLEDIKSGRRDFNTSEIMDGEYNAAADTIWTYYKPILK